VCRSLYLAGSARKTCIAASSCRAALWWLERKQQRLLASDANRGGEVRGMVGLLSRRVLPWAKNDCRLGTRQFMLATGTDLDMQEPRGPLPYPAKLPTVACALAPPTSLAGSNEKTELNRTVQLSGLLQKEARGPVWHKSRRPTTKGISDPFACQPTRAENVQQFSGQSQFLALLGNAGSENKTQFSDACNGAGREHPILHVMDDKTERHDLVRNTLQGCPATSLEVLVVSEDISLPRETGLSICYIAM
jgi:hypothetical protein